MTASRSDQQEPRTWYLLGSYHGTFFAFIIAVFKLYEPVRKFALFYNNFQQALGASSEIFYFMDTQDEVREKVGAPERRSWLGSAVCVAALGLVN